MSQPLTTSLTRMFDIQYPIISAPMFLVTTVRMVVATSAAGGIGTFPALNFRPIEKYREAIQEIKRQTQKPFGINIIVQKANKYQQEQLDIALEEKTPLLITSLGSPKDVIKRAHEVGTKVFCDVIGYEHAKKVADMGADGLIAVGSGAGGHAGPVSLLALIPDLVERVKLPVVAAGAIVDGKGMAAAFSLGAVGIYMGTRFIASTEAEVDEAYKQAIVNAKYTDIINTERVDGFPGNFILTPALERLGLQNSVLEEAISRSPRVRRWISMSRAARSLLGDPRGKASYKTVYSAGHGVGLIDAVKPIRQIIEDTMQEYADIKTQLP